MLVGVRLVQTFWRAIWQNIATSKNYKSRKLIIILLVIYFKKIIHLKNILYDLSI